jgi:hypothetical protein
VSLPPHIQVTNQKLLQVNAKNLLGVGYLAWGYKQPGHEVNHLTPCSVEVKKKWNCTSTPYIRFRGVDREKFHFFTAGKDVQFFPSGRSFSYMSQSGQRNACTNVKSSITVTRQSLPSDITSLLFTIMESTMIVLVTKFEIIYNLNSSDASCLK